MGIGDPRFDGSLDPSASEMVEKNEIKALENKADTSGIPLILDIAHINGQVERVIEMGGKSSKKAGHGHLSDKKLLALANEAKESRK